MLNNQKNENQLDKPSPAKAATDDAAQPIKKSIISTTRVIVAVVLVLMIAPATFMVLQKDASKTTDVTSAPSSSPTAAPVKDIKISVAEEGKLALPNGHADPTVVAAATGYRMYVNRQSGGPTGVLIYTSADGITWKKEKDIILPGTSTSRAIVLPTGVRLYYPDRTPMKLTDPPAHMLSSFSPDGLNFTKDPGTVVKSRSAAHYVEGPTVFQLPDKSWRMYFNENTIAAAMKRDGEIWGASSADGQTWTRDDQPTLQADDTEVMAGGRPAPWKQVLHPFVLKNPKGGYIMLYNSHSELYAATSADGLKWKKIGAIGVHGADIDGYFQADGTIRVFYGDYSPQTGGLVYMAVLKVQ